MNTDRGRQGTAGGEPDTDPAKTNARDDSHGMKERNSAASAWALSRRIRKIQGDPRLPGRIPDKRPSPVCGRGTAAFSKRRNRMIQFYANRRWGSCLTDDRLTTGSVGLAVRFSFSEEWEGLAKVVVFRGSGRRAAEAADRLSDGAAGGCGISYSGAEKAGSGDAAEKSAERG